MCEVIRDLNHIRFYC